MNEFKVNFKQETKFNLKDVVYHLGYTLKSMCECTTFYYLIFMVIDDNFFFGQNHFDCNSL